jgi:hypothetical protein
VASPQTPTQFSDTELNRYDPVSSSDLDEVIRKDSSVQVQDTVTGLHVSAMQTLHACKDAHRGSVFNLYVHHHFTPFRCTGFRGTLATLPGQNAS